MGLSFGQNCLAMDWLMTTTGAELAVSVALRSRPLSRGMCMVADVSGCRDADGDLGLFGHGDGGMAFDGDGLIGAARQGQIVDRASGLDAGQGADALEHRVEELRFLRGVGELLLVDHDGQGEDVVLVEAGVHGLEVPEAAEHEAGSDEQDEGERDLDDHEGGAGFAGSAVGVGAAEALLEGFVDVAFGHAPGGEEAREDAGRDGEGEGEGEDGAVEADVAHAGQLVGEELDEELDAVVGGDEAERASAEGDDQGFAEQLLDDARAGCAHGGADGDLFAAREGAGEDEVGDVGAGDEEHEGYGAEHHEESGTNVADGLFAQGFDGCAPALVVFGVGLLEALRDGVHLCLGLRERDAGFEAGDGEEVVFTAYGRLLSGEGEGNPELGETGLDHLRPHDADDGVGLSVEVDGFADDVGIGGVVGLPELVAEDDFVVSAGVVFFGQEDASVKRLDAEDGKEVGAYGACA